ncbi:hypothetical protein MHK_005291 [Candidatus Magnetomorum sp. HK-1]|nr:hypothetical protein MHK_005291 [Candidatus Magnetomorum sp. HK-1]
MAKLVECKTCKNLVAKRAKFCPHCGEKKPTKKKTDIKTVFAAIILMIFLAAIFGPTEEEIKARKQLEFEKKKEKIAQLDAEVKKIPADQYQENYFAYSKLVDLDPDNEKYQKKLKHYKIKYEIAKNIARTCRIESRKKNKASLNFPQTYDTISYIDKWEKGAYYYQEEFIGKNAFGVESKLVSMFKCNINKDKSISINKVFMKKAI